MSQFWPPTPRPFPRLPLAGQVGGVNSTVYTRVWFTPGYFTVTPYVVATVRSGGYFAIQIGGATKDFFDVAVGASSGILVDWIAVQN